MTAAVQFLNLEDVVMEIILYGSGRRCEILLDLIGYSNIRINGIVDSNSQRWGKKVKGIVIESTDNLQQYVNQYICVTFYSSLVKEPVWDYLEYLGFEKGKIFSFHDLLLYIYQNYVKISKSLNMNYEKKVIFDGAWPMNLGGVESWLRMIVPALNRSASGKVLLATEEKSCDINSEYIIDFCLYDTPRFSRDYIEKCINFLMNRLPCTVVFSRVDELLLAAALIKSTGSNNIKIIMADHGSCDGMYRDILSYKQYIDYYVCVSTEIADTLIKHGISPKIIETMTCPVIYESRLLRNYTENPNEPMRIGYAGRIEILEKRVDVLQRVILKLEEKKVRYILNIAGTGSEFESLKFFVEKNGLNNHVKLLGQLPNSSMPEFWANQDIALNTSDNEGRPLSNMEAMSNGAVPVVTRTIGVLDDVRDGINGYIVPINDAETMAEKIRYLDKHRNLLKQFGQEAREEISTKIDLNRHVEQWKKILEKVGE